jgi:hypothetical protein
MGPLKPLASNGRLAKKTAKSLGKKRFGFAVQMLGNKKIRKKKKKQNF